MTTVLANQSSQIEATEARAPQRFNRIVVGDCVRGMRRLPDAVVDLAFADPPFNIGYEYDKYQDDRPHDEYLDWSRSWMREVKRVLKPTGAFWLAIGDEYAAELKVLATRDLGFVCRSWVVWYYTFGVHCESKFTRSHAHLFHFVCDPDRFVFNASALRVPSARQLVYADKRANPNGRVPDDTWLIRPASDPSWILRPQDVPEGFRADSDTWYFPRVCGTFRERMGFHGCQMPEQLLGRIIKACSNEADLVIDPFVGSGTTLAVAKKLGRQYFGCELSPDYAKEAQRRLENARVGSPLDGSQNPLISGPVKPSIRAVRAKPRTKLSSPVVRRGNRIRGLIDFEREIISAFDSVRSGYSTDRVIADPEMNAAFISHLKLRGAQGEPADWNLALLRMRKANLLHLERETTRTKLDPVMLHRCEFAAEIALRQMKDRHDVTLDALLCDPAMAREFDQLASEIAPGFPALYYRWAALRIRKEAKDWLALAQVVASEMDSKRFHRSRPLDAKCLDDLPEAGGLYQLRLDSTVMYVGDTANLLEWATEAAEKYDLSKALRTTRKLEIAVLPVSFPRLELTEPRARKGAKSLVVSKRKPRWNVLLDRAA